MSGTKTSPSGDLIGGSGLGVVGGVIFVKEKIIKPIIKDILYTKIHILNFLQ